MAGRRLPSVASEAGLSRYLREIRKFPMLEAPEEYRLAERWREHGDSAAAHALVTSHLRLVAKLAMGQRGYGLPVGELISEGNIGMMQAVKRFEPERGFRLATYAMWWIRASIQEYILRSWSLVRIGTTSAQKKLFFNLRKIKSRLRAFEEGDLPPEVVAEIAHRLHVPETDVVAMNRRLSAHDQSLNVAIGDAGGDEWQDWLVDGGDDQEVEFAAAEERQIRRRQLMCAMVGLNAREQRIFTARRLADDPLTLEALGREYEISRERVRQIESRAFEKVQKAMLRSHAEQQRAVRDTLDSLAFPGRGSIPQDCSGIPGCRAGAWPPS